jgi:hypothetical protein
MSAGAARKSLAICTKILNLHNSGFKSIAFTKLQKLQHKKISSLAAFFGQENRYSPLIVLVFR